MFVRRLRNSLFPLLYLTLSTLLTGCIEELIPQLHNNPSDGDLVARSQNLTTLEDSPLNSVVEGEDALGRTFTFHIEQNPTQGALSLNETTGEFTYTPDKNFFGIDSFSFYISADGEQSGAAVILIDVTSVNDAPIANAGSDQIVMDSDSDGYETVTLNASASSDIDGSIVSYRWLRNSSEIATGVSPSISLALGVHTVTLEVTDDEGAQGIDEVSIEVRAANQNQPPIASAGPDIIVLDSDNNGSENVSLDGTASNDPDGNIVSYEWLLGGNIIASGASTNTTLAVGEHSITLEVTDDSGEKAQDQLIVTVRAPGGSSNVGADLALVGNTAASCQTIPPNSGDIVYIDSNWLDANGPSPYYLDQRNTTYVLETDVSTPGTAFALIESNITLDLNGHTILFNDANPIQIANASFESGSGQTASLWDFSGAPNAERHLGVWNYNEVYEGEYSLKFSVPSSDQSIRSQGTITLEPNTTYSLSAMFEYGGRGEVNNPGVKAFVRLEGSGLPDREVSWSSTNWRGIQWVDYDFTTGNSSEQYEIFVGIQGASSVPATAFYIDDIKIRRRNTYGVAVSTHAWSPANYPQITRWGRATGAVVKNGLIRQGSDAASWSNGVFIMTTDNTTVNHLDIVVHGDNSSAIRGKDQSSGFDSEVFCNSLANNGRTIRARDHFDGAVVRDLRGSFYNNSIHNGPHAGFKVGATELYNNYVSLRSKYTNGFAILSGGEIYNNYVECAQPTSQGNELACRGIAGFHLHHNTINIQNLANSQEYEGQPLGGAYGIQTENGNNVRIYNNDVTVFGREVPAYAYRANSDGGTSNNISVYSNIFRAVSDGHRAATVRLSNIPQGVLQFEDNTLITNDGILGNTAKSVITSVRSHIVINTPVNDPYVFESGYGVSPSAIFRQTTYENAFSQSFIQSAQPRHYHRYGGGPNPNFQVTFE